MDQEQFQTILSVQDYRIFLGQKQKIKQYQLQINEASKNNTTLLYQNKRLKKSFFMKKQQVKYLTNLIESLIKSFSQKEVYSGDNGQQAQFQNLVQTGVFGLSSIQMFQLSQQFDKSYRQMQFELTKIEQILNSSKQYYKRVGQSRLSLIISKKDSNQHPNQHSQLNNDTQQQIQYLQTIEDQLEENKQIVDTLLQEKIRTQKQLEIYKTQVKNQNLKITQYQYKMFNHKNNKQDKAYFIKLLLDQYNRELQKKLINLQLSRQDIDIIIQGELGGIRDYISAIIQNSQKLIKKQNKYKK